MAGDQIYDDYAVSTGNGSDRVHAMIRLTNPVATAPGTDLIISSQRSLDQLLLGRQVFFGT